jgi:RNA polymerase sigma-70 factor (ECF subfamily)
MLSYPPDMVEKTEAAIRGDGRAAGYLFEWFHAPLLAHALRICGNTSLARDALQDAFISAYTKLPALRDSAMFYPWLRSILLRKCYRLAQKEKRTSASDLSGQSDAIIRNMSDEQLEHSGSRFQLYEVLQGLSDELRACVMLRYFSQFNSYDDIALILSIPVGTVRSRLAAARDKMKMLYPKNEDAYGAAWRAAQEWSSKYTYWWGDMYDDMNARGHLLQHMHPQMRIRFTSGKVSDAGHAAIAKELDADLHYGTFFRLREVCSCGDISIIEGPNVNSREHPDRCAPSTVFVTFRQDGVIRRLHIFDSPRKAH